MDEKTLCPLVQDLMPSLADGITQPESERMMREHMLSCTVCRDMYAKMQTPEDNTVVPDEIPVEKFVQKQRRLKRTVIILALMLFLTLLGITLFITSLIPTPPVTEEIALHGTGFMLGNNPGTVDVMMTGELKIYHEDDKNRQRADEEDIGVLIWDTFQVTDTDGNPIFDNEPYEYTLPAWLPLQEDNGIKSPLGVYNDRDMTDFTYFGNLYARNKLSDFLLYDLTADGGYIICYPCDTKEEAERMLYQYVEEFDLGGMTESHIRRILAE